MLVVDFGIGIFIIAVIVNHMFIVHYMFCFGFFFPLFWFFSFFLSFSVLEFMKCVCGGLRDKCVVGEV